MTIINRIVLAIFSAVSVSMIFISDDYTTRLIASCLTVFCFGCQAIIEAIVNVADALDREFGGEKE